MTSKSHPNSSTNSFFKLPSIVLGVFILANNILSNPSLFIISSSQLFVVVFTNCVVVAFVYSVTFFPVNKKLK